jgi:hypothetical protein
VSPCNSKICMNLKSPNPKSEPPCVAASEHQMKQTPLRPTPWEPATRPIRCNRRSAHTIWIVASVRAILCGSVKGSAHITCCQGMHHTVKKARFERAQRPPKKQEHKKLNTWISLTSTHSPSMQLTDTEDLKHLVICSL